MLALLGKHFVDPSVIFIQNVLSVWNRFVRALEDELSPRPTRRLLLWYACQVSVLSNIRLLVSVTRLGDFLEFGQLFKALATINLATFMDIWRFFLVTLDGQFILSMIII